MINYRPFDQRTPDNQYRGLLQKIMDEGKTFIPIHARLPENQHMDHKESIDITGHILEYNLENGFPLETLRDLQKGFYSSVAEVCAFLNGVHTLEGLRRFGVPDVFWAPSLTKEKCEIFGLEEGDMGAGSYGKVLREMPGPNGTFFDQVLALERNAMDAPYSRTLSLTTWYPPFAVGDKKQGFPRKVVVAPCHGNFIRFKLYDQTKEVHMVMVPRSSDTSVGLMINVPQWCAVGMMLADLLGYSFTKYVVLPIDAQIYDIQYKHVEELLKREPKRLPTVRLKPAQKREHLWDYRPEDFILEDYHPHPGMKIPTTI